MAAAVEIGAEISSYSAHASHFPRSFGSRRRKGMERKRRERRWASALSRLEWNRPRAKFLMERVCLSSPRPRLRPSVACDAVVGMRKRPTECELSLHHDSRHSRAHIQMHQSEWLKVEILLRKTTRITRISYIRTGVITPSSTTPILGPSCSSSAHLPS